MRLACLALTAVLLVPAFASAQDTAVEPDCCKQLQRAWVDARIQAARQKIEEAADAKRQAVRDAIEKNRQIQDLRDKIQSNAIRRNAERINSIRDRNWTRDELRARLGRCCQPPVVQAPPLPTYQPPAVQYTPSTSAPPAIFQGGCRSGRCFGSTPLNLPSRVGYTVSKRILGGYKLKPVLY